MMVQHERMGTVVFQMEDMPHCCGAWYLIHCQPRKERYTSHALECQLGVSVFLPEYTIRSRGEVYKRPFFPGYLFIQADLQQVPPSRINSTPGVRRLVTFGNDWQPVPLNVIEMIYERLAQPNLVNLQPFQAGDRVRVKQAGPLQDLEMIFVGPSTPEHRVTVLLNLLGRNKEIYLDIDMLEKV